MRFSASGCPGMRCVGTEAVAIVGMLVVSTPAYTCGDHGAVTTCDAHRAVRFVRWPWWAYAGGVHTCMRCAVASVRWSVCGVHWWPWRACLRCPPAPGRHLSSASWPPSLLWLHPSWPAFPASFSFPTPFSPCPPPSASNPPGAPQPNGLHQPLPTQLPPSAPSALSSGLALFTGYFLVSCKERPGQMYMQGCKRTHTYGRGATLVAAALVAHPVVAEAAVAAAALVAPPAVALLAAPAASAPAPPFALAPAALVNVAKAVTSATAAWALPQLHCLPAPLLLVGAERQLRESPRGSGRGNCLSNMGSRKSKGRRSGRSCNVKLSNASFAYKLGMGIGAS
eukprot:1152021-Pelagomonas_calceolata.AAC.1